MAFTVHANCQRVGHRCERAWYSQFPASQTDQTDVVGRSLDRSFRLSTNQPLSQSSTIDVSTIHRSADGQCRVLPIHQPSISINLSIGIIWAPSGPAFTSLFKPVLSIKQLAQGLALPCKLYWHLRVAISTVSDPSGSGRVDMLTGPVAAARAVVATGAWVKPKHDMYLIRGSVGA